jgi:peptide/nickel transport system substrate-binding protein
MYTLSRRDFVRIGALTGASTLAAACAAPAGTPGAADTPAAPTAAAPAEPTAAPAEAPAGAQEAPILAEQVASGALPPLTERLPVEPMVIPVTEEIGQYGGVWHRCAVGPEDAWVAGRLSYEPLVRWNVAGDGVYPNLAKSFEISEDATQFTFYLREGVRWSDGEPFGADDILSYYEDGLMNESLFPTYPDLLRDPHNAGQSIEKVDDYTVVFTFGSPYGLFVQALAANQGAEMYQWPKHYVSQFHPNHTPMEDLDPKIKEAGFTNWWELFSNKRNWKNPDFPCLMAWKPVQVPPSVPVVWERNPFYWKVDPEGQQLPYIDSVWLDIVENADLLNMKAVAGEIDCQFRHITWTNYPLFIENAEQGDYRVFRWTLAEGSNFTLLPNYSSPDPVLQELNRTRDFRIALSHGINRDDLNELAYQGFGTARQASVVPECPYYKEEHAQLYTEYDPDKANALLDGIGLTERDAEGFRLRPDGEPLTISIEYAPVFGPWRDCVQMVTEQWQAIGIRAVPKEEDRTLYYQRAWERDMGVWAMDRCFTPVVLPQWFMPWAGGQEIAHTWWTWYQTVGEQGEEPPAEVKEQYALFDQIKGAAPAELPALAETLFENAARECWVIGTVGVLPHVGIVKNNFRNVPESAISDILQMTPGNTNVEQYFWKS